MLNELNVVISNPLLSIFVKRITHTTKSFWLNVVEHFIIICLLYFEVLALVMRV